MEGYRTYRFRDKDPVIDLLRTVIQDLDISYTKVSAQSGVSTTTLYNWFNGPTRRPQHCAVQAVARSLHYELKMVRRKNGRG